MRLTAKRLGPLKDATVELGDVTLFLGPPNTGKSYTLRALYARLFPLDDVAVRRVERVFASQSRGLVEKAMGGEVQARVERFVDALALLALLAAAGFDEPSQLERIVERLLGATGLEVAARKEGEHAITAAVGMVLGELVLERWELERHVRRAVDDFTWEHVPLEDAGLLRLEPFDVLEAISSPAAFAMQPVSGKTLLPWAGRAALEPLYLMLKVSEARLQMLFRKLVEELLVKPVAKVALRYSLEPSTRGLRVRSRLIARLRLETRGRLEYLEMVVKEAGLGPEELGRAVLEAVSRVEGRDRIVGGVVKEAAGALARGLARAVFREWLQPLAKGLLGYSGVRFVPFGRSLLVQGLENASRSPLAGSMLLRRFVESAYPGSVASYVYWASLGRRLLLEQHRLSEAKRRLVLAAAPLMEGVLEPGGVERLLYRDWRGSRVEFNLSSALVEEVSGLLFALLSVDGRAIVVVEEPEAQLHPGAQIVMALFLASLRSLCGCSIVASTHSDLLAITLAQLAVQKPGREQVAALLEDVLGEAVLGSQEVRRGVEVLADAAAESVGSLDLRVYEFTREGRVYGVRPADILGREVPGISRVVDALTDWAFRLSLLQRGGGRG